VEADCVVVEAWFWLASEARAICFFLSKFFRFWILLFSRSSATGGLVSIGGGGFLLMSASWRLSLPLIYVFSLKVFSWIAH